MDKNQELESMEERIARVKEESSEISEDKIKENRKKIHIESKKYFLLFILMMIVSGGLGYLVGGATKALERGLEIADIWEHAVKVLAVACPVINVAFNIIGLLVGILLLMKARKLLFHFDGEDDTVERAINYILNWVMLVTQCLFIVNYFLFTATCHFGIKEEAISESIARVLPLAGIANIAIGLVIILFLQYKSVEYMRLINPEKEVNIFDARLQSKLEGKMDEAELMTARKAGYKAYKRTTLVLIVMWIVCVVADLVFDAGLFPVALILFVLSIHVCTYVVEVMRLER